MTTRNISLLNAVYNAVPQVQLPISGGGTATFTEITDTTAAAGDVASGKYFYTSAGVRTQGTSSGGGGSALTKLATKNLGTISTSSTSAADTGQTLVVEGFDAYDILVCVAHTSPHTNGRHVATVRFVMLAATSTASTKTGTSIGNATEHYKLSSSGTLSCRVGTTPYGVYVNAASLSTTDGRKITLTIYQRYNSTSTGTINGSYVLDVYGLKVQDLL